MMVPCTVREICNAWLITFADRRTLLLTSESDRASFGVHCGALRAARDWDGCIGSLQGWDALDPTEIEQCPAEYADLAER